MVQNEQENMPQKDLRKLQLIELEILLELDRICRKYDIEYFLIAGTLLGAIRHNGFIPWDDDIDVAMKRESYERFCDVWEKENSSKKFFLQNYHTDHAYRWGYAKIRKKNTQYVRKGQEAIKSMSGVSIDLFIIDYVPDNYGLRVLHHYIRRGCIKTLWSIVGATEEPNMFLRMLYKILRHVPKTIPNYIEEVMAHSNNRKKRKYMCYTGFYRKTYYTNQKKNRFDTGLESSWFDEKKEVTFENHEFYTCARYEEYLNYMYGDYMKIPEKEKRENHPASSYIID